MVLGVPYDGLGVACYSARATPVIVQCDSMPTALEVFNYALGAESGAEGNAMVLWHVWWSRRPLVVSAGGCQRPAIECNAVVRATPLRETRHPMD